MLQTFYTDLYSGTGWPARVVCSLPLSLRPDLLRRLAGRRADLPPEKIRQFPWFGFARRLRKFRQNSPAGTRQVQLAANQRFGRLVAATGLAEANAVYVFNGAGLEILQAARERGLHTILDQTSAPVAFEEQLAREERERWHGWEIGGTPEAVWRPFADRERTEWQLANHIICGSEHIRRLIADEVPEDRAVQVVSYGIDASRFHARLRKRENRPLRVLYVGHLRLLKGIQYLAAATKMLSAAELEVRIIGQNKLSSSAAQQLEQCAELMGTVPRHEIQRHYDWADVFVLPTLSEGSAAVCYEALASGLPVITTPHAGSVIRDGVDGFIVPIRCPEQIADRLQKLVKDRELLSSLSEQSLGTAERFTIGAYAECLTATIRNRSPGV